MFEIGGDLHILAATGGPQFRHAGDFAGEAHASGAVDASGHDGFDEGAHVFFLDGALVFREARTIGAVGNRLILQVAFTALVAYRAIERVIDEQEFHNPLARLVHAGGFGMHNHAGSGGHGAAGDGLGHFFHLHQTHAAVAGDGKAVMVAKARNLASGKLAGLQQGGAREDGYFLAVDGELYGLGGALLCLAHLPASAVLFWRASMSGRKWRIKP